MLGKIDEILAWEKQKEMERDTRFVELGRYLCEVRAGQYWRVEKLASFDDFLERRFPTLSCGGEEQKILVGLTSLLTSQNGVTGSVSQHVDYAVNRLRPNLSFQDKVQHRDMCYMGSAEIECRCAAETQQIRFV